MQWKWKLAGQNDSQDVHRVVSVGRWHVDDRNGNIYMKKATAACGASKDGPRICIYNIYCVNVNVLGCAMREQYYVMKCDFFSTRTSKKITSERASQPRAAPPSSPHHAVNTVRLAMKHAIPWIFFFYFFFVPSTSKSTIWCEMNTWLTHRWRRRVGALNSVPSPVRLCGAFWCWWGWGRLFQTPLPPPCPPTSPPSSTWRPWEERRRTAWETDGPRWCLCARYGNEECRRDIIRDTVFMCVAPCVCVCVCAGRIRVVHVDCGCGCVDCRQGGHNGMEWILWIMIFPRECVFNAIQYSFLLNTKKKKGNDDERTKIVVGKWYFRLRLNGISCEIVLNFSSFYFFFFFFIFLAPLERNSHAENRVL